MLKANKPSSSEKLFSGNKNWFCQSNHEEQRKSYTKKKLGDVLAKKKVTLL